MFNIICIFDGLILLHKSPKKIIKK